MFLTMQRPSSVCRLQPEMKSFQFLAWERKILMILRICWLKVTSVEQRPLKLLRGSRRYVAVEFLIMKYKNLMYNSAE